MGECKSMVNDVSQFYKKNSRNDLIFNANAYVCKCPENGNDKNVNKCEKYCINEYDKKHGKSDYYAVINLFKDFNNAGNNIAHLYGASGRTAAHEIGHCLGLGHSGKYIYNKDKFTLDAYGDNQSVMGRYPSGFTSIISISSYEMGT